MGTNFETLPVRYYMVRNENTGKEYDFHSFVEADRFLNDEREERAGAAFVMYAVLDV